MNCGIKLQIIILNQKKTTMKKFLAIALIAASLTSCGGGKTEETPAADTTAAVAADTTAAAADTTAHFPAHHLAWLRSGLVRCAVDDDGGDGAGLPPCRPPGLRGQRHGQRQSDEGL